MSTPWFTEKNFEILEISYWKHENGQKAEFSIKLNDVEAINDITNRIEKLPVESHEMISFFQPERIELCFSNSNQKHSISIYDGNFQTPGTGFNNTTEVGIRLYKDIKGLIFSDFQKQLLKIKGFTYQFTHFSITFQETIFLDLAPKSLQKRTDVFVLKESNTQEQKLEITSMQIAPQPLVIQLQDKNITLRTYESFDGVRLAPYYFQITQ